MGQIQGVGAEELSCFLEPKDAVLVPQFKIARVTASALSTGNLF